MGWSMSLDNLSPKTIKYTLICVFIFIIYTILSIIFKLPHGFYTNANEFYSITTAGLLLAAEMKIANGLMYQNKLLFWGIPLIHIIFWSVISSELHFNPHSMDVLILSMPEMFLIPLIYLKIYAMLNGSKHKTHHIKK